ncbi:MAG: ester cyclase [Pseudomonadales bacterium]|nr:ester cyclase [Pseudomonadales bacterium]
MRFPTRGLIILDQVAESDKVVTRCRVAGTNDGPLGDVPPSGKPMDVSLQTMHCIEDCRIVEKWELVEQLQMLQQLGILSEDLIPTD